MSNVTIIESHKIDGTEYSMYRMEHAKHGTAYCVRIMDIASCEYLPITMYQIQERASAEYAKFFQYALRTISSLKEARL